MTINERVKHFRKDVLHISQTEFAVSLADVQNIFSKMLHTFIDSHLTSPPFFYV